MRLTGRLGGDLLDPLWIVLVALVVVCLFKGKSFVAWPFRYGEFDWSVCLSLLAEACDTNTCKLSEHKRCYPTQLVTEVNEVPACRCLKGLYELNGVCVGVIRYDFTVQLYIEPAFVNQRLSEERIKMLVS